MGMTLFHDRQDAARQLAERLRDSHLYDPLVLGIPRGGVVTAAMLARELDADMDVALARKLRHPLQQELAIGAISEDGEVYIEEGFRDSDLDEDYLQQERQRRMAELDHRRKMFREIRPAAEIAGRSVIITDDGIATGSTMHAALRVVRAKIPRETIVAVPVAPPGRFERLRSECDRAVAVLLPEDFMAISQFYEDFEQVDDEQVCEVLRGFAHSNT